MIATSVIARQSVRPLSLCIFHMKMLPLDRCVHGARGNFLAHISGQQITERKIMDAISRGGDIEYLMKNKCFES